MTQKLILPINDAKLTASWKTTAYTANIGYIHYGSDLISRSQKRNLYASGNGTVVGRGVDSVVGNVVVVRYPDAQNRVTGKVADVIFRYFHLASIAVATGQAVTKDTILGQYGTTGLIGTGAHLHLEADTDTAHPLYSPTVYNSSYLKGRLYGASDATMSSVIEWLYAKSSGPDNQSYTTAGDQYIRTADKTMVNTQ